MTEMPHVVTRTSVTVVDAGIQVWGPTDVGPSPFAQKDWTKSPLQLMRPTAGHESLTRPWIVAFAAGFRSLVLVTMMTMTHRPGLQSHVVVRRIETPLSLDLRQTRDWTHGVAGEGCVWWMMEQQAEEQLVMQRVLWTSDGVCDQEQESRHREL